MAALRHFMTPRMAWWWYLAPIVPIMAFGYVSVMDWLPPWALLLTFFAFFMWLFWLLFTVFATLIGKWRAPRESRQ